MKTKSLFIAAAALCASPLLHADSITIEGDLEVEGGVRVYLDNAPSHSNPVTFNIEEDGTIWSGEPTGFHSSEGYPLNEAEETMFQWNLKRAAMRFGLPLITGSQILPYHSTAWGYSNHVGAAGGTAWGQNNACGGYYTTVWGAENETSGNFSTAWGQLSWAGQNFATVWGFSNYATKAFSTAWGEFVSADGKWSTAWGEGTQAQSDHSTAWGKNSNALGKNSTAWGENTLAQAHSSTVFGRGNIGDGNASQWVATDPILEIGIGVDSWQNPANALTVLKNGNVGIGDHQPDELLVVAGTSRFEDDSVFTATVRIPPSDDLSMGSFMAGDDPSQ